MKIIIQLGDIQPDGGDASAHLIGKLSGLKLPLAGMARIPYLPGEEILSGFEEYLDTDGFYYLVNKTALIEALHKVSLKAALEVEYAYMQLNFLPFKQESCRIVSIHHVETIH